MIVPGGNNRTLIQEIVPNIQIKFFFVLFLPFTYSYNSSFMLNSYSSLTLWGSYPSNICGLFYPSGHISHHLAKPYLFTPFY